MALTESDVKNVAHLARIALAPDEIPTHVKNLTNILNLVAEMNNVDTTGIEPMAHPQEITQPLREDQVTEPNLRDKMQRCAPLTEAGLYLVPKVIEERLAETTAS
jgi:aspartyl-tRNA(Asn)/glutamyl-tRNA(Gln) amidotransferase subunit C